MYRRRPCRLFTTTDVSNNRNRGRSMLQNEAHELCLVVRS